ncbi:MAG: alpha/beta hydrolase [Ruminococcus sp.]|nr:alpha/beta hydrolase [Ruminococcus sp.]
MLGIKKIKIMYGSCSARVYGYIYENENEEKRKRSAVILLHGYNSCQDDLEYIAEVLANDGYLALTIDFRGGGKKCISMGETTDMSLKTEVEDAGGAVEFICRTRKGQFDRLFLYGESQGGLVASLTAASLSQKISGLFLLYPAFCIPEDMKKVNINEGETLELMGMDISKKYIDELPQFDVYDMMKYYGGKITIAHGDIDPIVNLRYSQRLFEQQKALGRDITLDVFPGESHGFKAEARNKWLEIILNRLKGE